MRFLPTFAVPLRFKDERWASASVRTLELLQKMGMLPGTVIERHPDAPLLVWIKGVVK